MRNMVIVKSRGVETACYLFRFSQFKWIVSYNGWVLPDCHSGGWGSSPPRSANL